MDKAQRLEAMQNADKLYLRAVRKLQTMVLVKEKWHVEGKIDYSMSDDEIKKTVGRSGSLGQELSAKCKAKGMTPDEITKMKQHIAKRYNISN